MGWLEGWDARNQKYMERAGSRRYTPFKVEFAKLAMRYPLRTALVLGVVGSLLKPVPLAGKLGLVAGFSLVFLTFFLLGRKFAWIGRGLERETLEQPIDWRPIVRFALALVGTIGVVFALTWLATS